MFITINEIIDILIMTFAIGYIFSSFTKRQPLEGYEPLDYYKKNQLWESIKIGIIIAAPAVVFHELAHKFVAMSYGVEAVLHAPLTLYIIVILMKMMNFPLLFFIGGYVSHAPLSYLPSAIVAFAGPFTNLILFLLCRSLIKFKIIHRKYYNLAYSAGQLNLFLFGFNMIPIPGFDGYSFFTNLWNFFGL